MTKTLTSLQPTTHVDEHKVRVVALLVLLITVGFLLAPSWWWPILLVLDFGLRSFDLGKYSPFGWLATQVVQWIGWPVKPIFYPPKRFAARIGLSLSLVILALAAAGSGLAVVVAGVLAFFAALESLAGICAGCYLYSWLAPLWNDRQAIH